MITVPDSRFGSMRPMSFCIAMMDVYSVPWLPETNATVRPGFMPRTTATSMRSAESEPGGTAMDPYAVVPGLAVADPTETVPDCCAAAVVAAVQRRMTAARPWGVR